MHATQRALTWRTSSHSGGQNNCVQLADHPAGVAVRDSKNPDGGALLLPPEAWRLIADRVKAGEFNL